ncbi:hypothetical protein P12x_001945 [Tundrisphaera lichenicola]|uniref:hypothetical protein n=1 Tax=Tundrisphaera lichenicola TaxID=2029860 RepID=UPI003EB974E7
MRVIRFEISSLMVLIAIFAIDLWTIQTCYARPGPSQGLTPINLVNQIDLLVRGALPMANILAIGLILGLRRQKIHPSLPGFEAFGVLALALYSISIIYACHHRYLRYGDFVPAILVNQPIVRQVVASIFLVSPQLGFALLGGFLTRSRSVRVGNAGPTSHSPPKTV